MALNLDVIIETPDYSVDMKSGLDSFQGMSDSVRCIGEAVLGEKLIERKTPKGRVRTILKGSFKGSYGLNFTMEIHDEELLKKFRKIGRDTFSELISYYLNDSMYKDVILLSEKAQKIITGLGDVSDQLSNHLRNSMLKDIHDVPIKFDHDIRLRYRKNRDEHKVLARFDKVSAQVVEAIPSQESVELVAVITRLNTRTGNGRLQLTDEEETIAFGFYGYKEVDPKIKKILSENLDKNNTLPQEHWDYLKISAYPLQLPDLKIIKYFIKNAETIK